jgi:hypothetical protein
MNFSFMITIIFIILIFIKLNIKNIPNYCFLGLVVILLGIGELYSFKENFKPYRYDGIYDRYYENKDLLHLPESISDTNGLRCMLQKNVRVKGIQDKKFSEYQDLKNSMNNVLYGDKQFDEIKFPENYGDISNEKEQIDKVNEIMCPPVCHLINTELDCNAALDLKTQLQNDEQLNSTKPIFDDKYMMDEAYKCLNIENPSARNCGNNCRVNSDINKCTFDIKKCSWDSDNEKCRKRCSFYDREGSCPGQYCNWDTSELKCVEK